MLGRPLHQLNGQGALHMRNHPYGTIQDAVQSSYRASGHTNEEIAELLGVRGSTISYGAEMSEARPGGLGVNYLHRLGRMRPEAAVPIAQHFARLGGGVFQPQTLNGRTAGDVHRLTREFSDVLQCHAAAHSASSASPQDYTAAEAAMQIRELDEMVAVAMAFRAALVSKAEAA